jgi:hypothetical protein
MQQNQENQQVYAVIIYEQEYPTGLLHGIYTSKELACKAIEQYSTIDIKFVKCPENNTDCDEGSYFLSFPDSSDSSGEYHITAKIFRIDTNKSLRFLHGSDVINNSWL